MFYSLANRPARAFHRHYAPVVSNGALEKFLNDTFSSLSDTVPPKQPTWKTRRKPTPCNSTSPAWPASSWTSASKATWFALPARKAQLARSKPHGASPWKSTPPPATAKLENGVLTLTLGKKVPVSNVTHLDIQ
jgi:HSP20 family protein